MLTRVGRNTLLASAALYGAALALGYPELAVPASAGITALGAALITVARRPRLLVTLSVTPARVSRGQQVAAKVALKNGGESRSPRFALSLPHGAGTAQMAAGRLAKHGSWEIPLLLRCDRRGLIKIGPLTIEQGDVFGLCRRVQIAADAVTVHVHPVVYPLPLPSARRLRHAEGISSPQAPDGGITFHSLREYVPGDDLRYVHWLASAKNAGGSGSLLVRRHVDPGDVSSAVILDTRASHIQPTPVAARSRLRQRSISPHQSSRHQRGTVFRCTCIPLAGQRFSPGLGGKACGGCLTRWRKFRLAARTQPWLSARCWAACGRTAAVRRQ